MKYKKHVGAFVAIVAGILLLAWMSGGFRERFDQVPIFTGGKDKNNDAIVFNKIKDIAVSMGYKPYDLAWRGAEKYGPIYKSATTVPTKDEFLSQFGGKTTYSQLTGDDKLLVDVLYEYFYGSSSSSPPAGSPASSVPPMTATIPSPCSHSFKSIPGGTMEFRCFDN